MNEEKREIWFVYDGECPICKTAALGLRIKQDYGKLNLVNARELQGHFLDTEITQRQLDLDEGMIIYDGQQFYHGKTALRFMAKYSDKQGWFNFLNKTFFWSESIAFVTYLWMRGVRNLLLRFKKVKRIDNLQLSQEPTFKAVFGESWSQLPAVMQKHYANRPYTQDRATVEGKLDFMCAGPIKWFAPLFWLLGGIPPHNENDVPVTVHFDSDLNSKSFYFNRIFHFKQRKPYCFSSRMLPIKDNELVEIMRFGLGWRMQFVWEEGKVKLKHKGYVLHWFGHFIPVPFTFILGEGNAEETPIDENSFAMWVQITHPWWGEIYEYKGQFTVTKEA